MPFQLDDLSEEQRAIAEAIGVEAYEQLVKCFGGSYIYVSNNKTIGIPERNREIYSMFTGSNHRELAKRYGLSTRQIRHILKREMMEVHHGIR